jgi:hypothetical protein
LESIPLESNFSAHEYPVKNENEDLRGTNPFRYRCGLRVRSADIRPTTPRI